MPLQNRVTPFGEIAALEGRGMFMGNRGILVDEEQHLVRAWQSRRWITCLTEFRGIRRKVMQPHHYTELFFLDEATAFAAGHRPCAECRRDDYQRFRSAWMACHGEPASADAMDLRMHADRLNGHKKRTYAENVVALPDGAYVAIEGIPWLVWDASLLAWSNLGYTARQNRPAKLAAEVLTPRSVVAVLASGYRPAVHPSVQSFAW